MAPAAPALLGILNLSDDSFFDGGRFGSLDQAILQAKHLHEHSAQVVDLGAVSSNPDGKGVPPTVEIARLRPLVNALQLLKIPVSIDSFAAETQRWAAPRVSMLNDIRGFPDPQVWPHLAAASCKLVVMHQVQQGRADRRHTDAAEVIDSMFLFFETRLQALLKAGIGRDRLIVDPGMGFFLGSTPEPSIAALQRLPELRQATGCPVLVGVSRKSFLGAICGGRPPDQRGPATLAAELYAAAHGADWIRTHDVRGLRDALRVQSTLMGPSSGSQG